MCSILRVFGIPVILCLQELKLVFDAITRVWRGEFERLCRLRRSLKNKDNRWEIWFDMTSKCSDEQPRHQLGSCRLKGYSTPKWKLSLNHLPSCRSKPVKASFIFGTQFKIFWMKTGRLVPTKQLTLSRCIKKNIVGIVHLPSVVQP